jgi:hypothetical protein
MKFKDAYTGDLIEIVEGHEHIIVIKKSNEICTLRSFDISFDENTLTITGYKALQNDKFELCSITLKS